MSLTPPPLQNGAPKILKDCSLPLTGRGVVNRIITELAVFDVVSSSFQFFSSNPLPQTKGGLELLEVAPGVGVEEVQAKTGCPFKVSDNLKTMDF
jgi:acyl CoA:acetate/3-ketoacid CoA transferase beta subunit